MSDAKGKPDKQQIRGEAEKGISQALSPANFFTKQRWNDLHSEAYILELLLSTEPLIRASVKKYPSDWSRIFRVIQARLDIQPQIPRLRVKHAMRPDLFSEQVAKCVRVRSCRIKLPKSSTTDNFRIPLNAPLRLLSTLHEFAPVVGAMLRGETVNLDQAELRRMWRSFSAGDPGARRKEIYKQAYALKKQGMTLHTICIRLRRDYQTKSSGIPTTSAEQSLIRKSMGEGIRRFARSLKTTQMK